MTMQFRRKVMELPSIRALTVSLFLALASPSFGATLLTFDDQADSTIITNQYPAASFSNTIVLTAGITLNEFEFPPRSGRNVISDNGGPVRAVFSVPQSSVEVFVTYNTPVTLRAFDINNNLISSVTSRAGCVSNTALSGTAGCGPNERLSLTSTIGIVSVTITGAAGGNSFTADDLQFAPIAAVYASYASNLNLGDSVINLSNTGENGNSISGPGFGSAAGNVCVNVYSFSPDEQLISCCSCLITPNGLASISVNNDLLSNTLTGIRPNAVVVKLLNTGAGSAFTGNTCSNSAALAGTASFPLAGGLTAFGTSVHPTAGGPVVTTERPFPIATPNAADLASLTNRCTNIVGNGSSFGVCRSCRNAGLHVEKK